MFVQVYKYLFSATSYLLFSDHRLPEKLTTHETKVIYEVFKMRFCSVFYFELLFKFYFFLIILLLQVRELETDRLSKWLKMLKNWDKYSGGEKVRAVLFSE